MKLITHLRNALFPFIVQQNRQLAALQNAHQQVTQQYHEQAVKVKALLKEIEFLYSILVHRNRYRYHLHILPHQPPLLFTVNTQQDKTTFYLYIPSECEEIATLSARMWAERLLLKKWKPVPLFMKINNSVQCWRNRSSLKPKRWTCNKLQMLPGG